MTTLTVGAAPFPREAARGRGSSPDTRRRPRRSVPSAERTEVVEAAGPI